MKQKVKIFLPLVIFLGLIGALVVYLRGHNVAVLSPAGQISHKERNLMTLAILLSVLVVVPVYAMTIGIVLKYREGNKKAKKYTPDWDRSKLFESLWWGIPGVIIVVLSVVTWQSSHALDPFKPLASTVQPLHVQVVALDWKWLFVYPAQHVASVNRLELPVGRPVTFDITSDSVMNSFWIPRLGGQIYAMPGMSTQLHLMADKSGSYAGSSANISGKGFAGMAFTAHAVASSEFDAWAQAAQTAPQRMDIATYVRLSRPTQNVAPTVYAAADSALYNDVVMKYMMPGMTLGEAH